MIGMGGNTGRSTGSHLHLEMRYLGEAINPANVIDFATGKLKNEKEYKANSYFRGIASFFMLFY